MKKLLLLLFSLLLSFNSFGEWVYIDKEKNSDAEIYLLTESIEVDEDYVYWTYLNNYSKPRSEYNIMGLAIFRGGDCKNNRYVNIESQMFQGSMGSKPFADRLKHEQEWITPTSGQIDEKIFNYVCDYAGFSQAEVEDEDKPLVYTCDLSGIYGHPAKLESTYIKTSGNKVIFTIEDNDGYKRILINEDSTIRKGQYFIIQDYSNEYNFNATARDETYSFTNLAYEKGYLTYTWLMRDSGAMGALFSKCTISR